MSRGPKRTFDIDRLRLLAQTMSARQVASEMGVSTQRVYQIAKREDIAFAVVRREPRPYRPRQRANIQRSRLITGGVSEEVGSSRVSGRICELLAAADLVARGWKVFFPMNMGGPHDLVAYKNGALLSFEVRAAKKRPNGNISFNRDKVSRSDHYALVVRGEPIQYEPVLQTDT